MVPVSRDDVRRELNVWEATLIPADPRTVAVLLDQTLEVWGLPENWSAIARFYLEAFQDVPLDLVEVALHNVRMNSKWFPKPSELRAPIQDELMRRVEVCFRLRTADRFGTFRETTGAGA